MDRQAITPQPQARNARGGRRGEGLFVSRGRPKGRGKRLSGPRGPDPPLRSRDRGAAVLRSDQPLERPYTMPDVSTEKGSVSIRRLLSAHTRKRNGVRNGRVTTGDAACKAPRHYVGTWHDQLLTRSASPWPLPAARSWHGGLMPGQSRLPRSSSLWPALLLDPTVSSTNVMCVAPIDLPACHPAQLARRSVSSATGIGRARCNVNCNRS
jgi:hypothetical protein